MVTLSEFKNNLKELLKQYLYSKEETHTNYNNYIESNLGYSNGELCIAEDFIYYNDGSDINLHNPQNSILSIVNNTIRITTNTSGEKKVNFPTVWFTSNDNVFVEMTWCGGANQPIALSLNNSSNSSVGWLSHNGNSTFTNGLSTSSRSVTGTIESGDVFRLSRENGVTKFYQNGVLLFQATRSISNYRFGFYTNNGRVQMWKNVKIGYIK